MLRLGSLLRHPQTLEPAHVVQFRGVGHAVCRTKSGQEFTIGRKRRGPYATWLIPNVGKHRRPDGVCRGVKG
jgi:hypothetical protein